jgi:hypothetical protein
MAGFMAGQDSYFPIFRLLESTLPGISYRFKRRNDPGLDKNEYSHSGTIFSAFLTRRPPFCKVFDAPLAVDFHTCVRCALLHEALTSGGWIVKAKGAEIVVVRAGLKIVCRNNFHQALLDFIEWYRLQLPNGLALQEAFIRKFEGLCV